MKQYSKKRKILMAFFAIVLVVCLVLLALRTRDYLSSSELNKKMQDQFQIADATDAMKPDTDSQASLEEREDVLISDALSYFEDTDFSALTQINDEILGWIVVPGTNISYPICQHSDNSYYLNHTSEKQSNLVGAIFADYRIKEPFTEFNTIIYGHRLLNQTMFSALKYYVEKSFWEEHPYIYIYTPESVYVYEIYAAFWGDPNGLSYHTGIRTEEKRQSFIDYTRQNSYYDTGIRPGIEDSFLTLSTCTGSGHTQRMIVHSYLVSSKTLEG